MVMTVSALGAYVVHLDGAYMTSMGYFMWPHAFGATFTAKSGDTLRRNAVVMPLYTLTPALMFFAGFAAVLIVPGREKFRWRWIQARSFHEFPLLV
jgi:Na+/proline symporter